LELFEEAEEEQNLGYRLDPDRKEEWIREFTRTLRPVGPLVERADLDEEAEEIHRALTTAMERSMPRRKGAVARSAPYWNGECSRMAEAVHNATREDRHRLSLQLTQVLARAKVAQAHDVTENATTDKIFQYAKWTAGRARRGLGPIRAEDGTLVTENTNKADVLYRAFFPEVTASVAIDQPWDLEPVNSRDFPGFTMRELMSQLAGTSNTSAPGASGHGYQVIKWACGVASKRLLRLFSACLYLGYHPRILSQF
jgi:hypothetical protein